MKDNIKTFSDKFKIASEKELIDAIEKLGFVPFFMNDIFIAMNWTKRNYSVKSDFTN